MVDVDDLYRREYGRILATLIRQVGEIELAEDALHDAFAEAIDNWTREGESANAAAWITTAARRRAIDRLRRRGRTHDKREAIEQHLLAAADDEPASDDVLRLVFTCCHPALAPEAQVALALRTLCGLTTEEIAHA